MTAAEAAEEPLNRAPDEPPAASGELRALTLAWVDGTYLGTTMAVSRHERVAVSGLGQRVRAAMVVDDGTIRWEREGTGDVKVAGPLLLGVRLERRLVGRLRGQAHHVLISWKAPNDPAGKLYSTGFLPRRRADSAVLVSAAQRLMQMVARPDETPTKPDGRP